MTGVTRFRSFVTAKLLKNPGVHLSMRISFSFTENFTTADFGLATCLFVAQVTTTKVKKPVTSSNPIM
jgi:hypothetical protein